MYVDVIIPLAVQVAYSYEVPVDLEDRMRFGIRIEVPFGPKKLYAALVVKVHNNMPIYKVRSVLSVLDEDAIITERQLQLWEWVAKYYVCGLGEVMHAAVPSRLKLHSETIIMQGAALEEKIFDLDDRAYMIAEAVQIQKELTIDEIRSILEIKTVYPLIKYLLDAEVITLKEELQERFAAKVITGVRLIEAEDGTIDTAALFDQVSRSDHQTRALLAIMQLSKDQSIIPQQTIIKTAGVTHSVLQALEKKGIVERFNVEVSRLKTYDGALELTGPLSDQQVTALAQIKAHQVNDNKPILLHGVTGSGKTRVYIELMKTALAEGRQVLYLLPEIALTTQIVSRLKKVFADDLHVYHSKINENQRVEVWKHTLGLPKILLGARSSVFLPFSDLGLIIVDEEHDGSYKQEAPNPRYQARDTAIFLSHLHKCPIILGSATPAIESYFNATMGKYHLVKMPKRFGDMPMPEIVVVDLKRVPKAGNFSNALLDEMEQMRKDGFQSILFRNRRGFAPVMLCGNCGWNTDCKNCDVTLTYHQYRNEMQCHLCGYHEKPALVCPACGNHELILKGFGTEKLEDEVKIRWPEMRVARLDLDTARGQKKLEQIIGQFEQKELDVLIGTQMISKGLDFENVGLVGIVAADQMLHYPDFRASERAFQLMTQVSGRSGRKHRRGRVIIQAYEVTHPVILDVVAHDYGKFYQREINERKEFGFPPFSRIIQLNTQHTDQKKSEAAALFMVDYLIKRLGDRVRGPIVPSVARVRNRYINVVMIKLEKNATLIRHSKDWIKEALAYLKKQKGMSTLRLTINVDP